ncbi:MAG TPA: glycosyltransferase [Candidatus Nanoarchaeia archaeon]|nr:glycosyltransferase [Candidatus Nanoarchaeia archaeon]
MALRVRKLKIAIVTEFLYFKGGIEKSILALLEEFEKRDIAFEVYAGLYDPEKTFAEFKRYKIHAFRKDKLPDAINALWLRRKFGALRLKGYDGYILFGSHSIAAAKHHHPNVLWSTRPLAYVYGWDGKGPDINTRYLYGRNFIRKIAVSVYLRLLRQIDQRQIRHVTRIRTVGMLAERALRNAYPKKEISVLYAPVDTQKYAYVKKGSYYLNVARHVPDKNVDRIVRAFQKMPDKMLYQVGDGDGSIQKLAAKAKNIKILGFKSEKELRKLMGESIAMISASEGEDFSMNLMESLASGKPTISVNLDRNIGKMQMTDTGVLMPNSQSEEIIEAARLISADKAESMRKACEKKSKLFSRDNFVKGLLNALSLPD